MAIDDVENDSWSCGLTPALVELAAGWFEAAQDRLDRHGTALFHRFGGKTPSGLDGGCLRLDEPLGLATDAPLTLEAAPGPE